jgi:hypothetical protein
MEILKTIKMRKMEGKIVKVNPVLEEIIRKIAEKYDLQPSTIRNTMILYGLLLFTLVENAPKNDEDFFRLLGLLLEFLEGRKDGEDH